MAKLGFTVAKEKSEEATKSTAKYNYFKLKVNEPAKIVRFITVDGPEKSILTYGEHYLEFKNTWGRAFSCPDYGNEDGTKECKICKMDKGPGHDIVKDQFGTKFIMQLIERGGNPDGSDALKVYKFSPFFFTTLIAFYEKTKDIGDRDYSIQMIKEPDENGKDKLRYEFLPLTAKKSPLSEEDKALIETRAQLVDIEPPYDMNEVNRMAAMEVTSGKPTIQSASNLIGDFLATAKKPTKSAEVEEDAPVTTASTEEAVPEDDEDITNFFSVLAKQNKK